MVIDLNPFRELLREQVLPAYEALGALALAYMQGSLVSGYTERADLDLVLVWDQAEVPAERIEAYEGLHELLDEGSSSTSPAG